MSSSALLQIKFVVVGDPGVGKSSLIEKYCFNRFPVEHTKPRLDTPLANAMVIVDGRPICLEVWDSVGQDDYDRLRPLSYPQTDIFLICFSVDNPQSCLSCILFSRF